MSKLPYCTSTPTQPQDIVVETTGWESLEKHKNKTLRRFGRVAEVNKHTHRASWSVCLTGLSNISHEKKENNMLLYEGQVWRFTFIQEIPSYTLFLHGLITSDFYFCYQFHQRVHNPSFCWICFRCLEKIKHIFSQGGLMVIFSSIKNHLKTSP